MQYRGIPYTVPTPSVPMHDREVHGQFRGQSYVLRHVLHRRLKEHPRQGQTLKYRGISLDQSLD